MKRYGIILLTSLILLGCSATQKAEEKEQKDPAVAEADLDSQQYCH
ncbi:MAG: hypothetical protein ACLT16_19695 [[Clostridium] innocuum]